MLKNLFTRIKSEKQSTIKSQEKNQPFQTQNKTNDFVSMTPEKETLLKENLCKQATTEQNIVNSLIQKVRYWRDEKIPDIFTRVLSCPVSHFNLLPHSKRKVKEIDLKKDKFPQYLQFMKPLLLQQLPGYNHILINHYPKGVGIMHHFDGPLYNDRVIVLSLGGPVIISFQSGYSKQTQSMKILLQDRSVHIFQQNAYIKYLHGIQDKKIDAFTFTIKKSHQIDNLDKQESFIKLTNKFDKETYFITECSIENLEQIHSILTLIEKNINYLVFCHQTKEQNLFFIEFNENQGISSLKGCFIFINQIQNTQAQKSKNQTWRWKMQIQRQQRISITIRQKYQHSKS